jgi:hypothetical protein
MASEPLEQLRRLVVDDPAVRRRLLPLTDRQSFVDGVLAVARENGIGLTADDIEAGLAAARRRRHARWV